MVTTSSDEAIHPGSGLSGSLTQTMVRVGLTRPSTNPTWMPSSADRGSPRAKAAPSRTAATPRSRAAPSMRLRVPIWSSGPHRPQLETRAANSANDVGMEGETGTGTDPLYPNRATVFRILADRSR